jgi:hypothetical protein
MTIEQTGVADIIAVSPSGDTASLIISDHLAWEDGNKKHMLLVQEKINEYLSFIESGALFDARPDLKGKRLIIKVIGLYKPPDDVMLFYEKVRDVLANAGYPFLFGVHSVNSIREQ